jgi:hypothetical protein
MWCVVRCASPLFSLFVRLFYAALYNLIFVSFSIWIYFCVLRVRLRAPSFLHCFSSSLFVLVLAPELFFPPRDREHTTGASYPTISSRAINVVRA